MQPVGCGSPRDTVVLQVVGMNGEDVASFSAAVTETGSEVRSRIVTSLPEDCIFSPMNTFFVGTAPLQGPETLEAILDAGHGPRRHGASPVLEPCPRPSPSSLPRSV